MIPQGTWAYVEKTVGCSDLIRSALAASLDSWILDEQIWDAPCAVDDIEDFDFAFAWNVENQIVPKSPNWCHPDECQPRLLCSNSFSREWKLTNPIEGEFNSIEQALSGLDIVGRYISGNIEKVPFDGIMTD